MANLIEKNEWTDSIYQIEKTDPVVGGADGISNKQAQQLANRTKYLKGQVESLNHGKAASSHSHTIAQITDLQNTLNSKATNTDLTNAQNALTTEINKKATKDAFSALHDLMVGIPFPYPLSTVPSGCLAMNGQKFNTSTYPILAKKYPNGVLPDLRGEFIRGWDNGRGVDSGRGLLAGQLHALQDHFHLLPTTAGNNYETENNIKSVFIDNSSLTNHGLLATINSLTNKGNNYNIADNTPARTYSSRIGITEQQTDVKVGNENRPRNIAFHYICLAA
ncbi:tail fiber protein [Lonepinella sp. BR2357]|uniref:tail fiber protein n=1 Tax=Lonepinella sp. BR2357 TaxID=3434549 RepID=UPI003F6E3C6E